MLVDNERINNRFREGYNKLRVIDLRTGPVLSTRWRGAAPDLGARRRRGRALSRRHQGRLHHGFAAARDAGECRRLAQRTGARGEQRRPTCRPGAATTRSWYKSANRIP
jgi:hypothetical protein